MPQSLTNVLVHLVFSKKNRQPLLGDPVRSELHSYIEGIIHNLEGSLVRAGSVSDHIHLLLAEPRKCPHSELVGKIKTSTSSWLKKRGHEYDRFQWQRGYGIFSISPSHKVALEKYIDNQAKHHRSVSFQEEYLRLLFKYEIKFDERYVWG